MEGHLCSQIGRISVVEMPTLPKVSYRFNAILPKIIMIIFKDIEKKF